MARLSAEDWIRGASRQLAEGGVASIRVEPLAKALGVSKGSFYWHFEDRAALLTSVAEAWEQQHTLAVIHRVDELASTPEGRLWALFEEAFGAPLGADGMETALRAWAATDNAIKKLVRRVDRRRLRYVTNLLRDAGVEEGEAARRADLIYCTMVGEFLQRTYGKAALPEAALRSLHGMMLRP